MSSSSAAAGAAAAAAPPLQLQDQGRPVRQLKWDESNHFSIITQLHGSVIPKVVPFCIVNSLWTAVLYELKKRDIIDLTSSPSGHKYLAVIMSFLLVSRVKIMYDRYMYSATSLTQCFKACRETVQYTVALSQTDMSERAKQWRHDVAHAVIVMLRVTAAVLEFQSNPSQVPWALNDIHHHHTVEMQDTLFLSPFAQVDADTEDDDDDNVEEDDSLRPPPRPQHQAMLAHTSDDERTMLEEACRAPIILAFNVRKEIMKQRNGTWLETKKVWYHPCNEEMRLLGFVGEFLHHFHNLRKLIVTPVPFPMVNMSKIFLFLWVFTVPFAVCHYDFKMGTIVPAAIIFLITFGFVGLEYVSMELSDPFGDDVSTRIVPDRVRRQEVFFLLTHSFLVSFLFLLLLCSLYSLPTLTTLAWRKFVSKTCISPFTSAMVRNGPKNCESGPFPYSEAARSKTFKSVIRIIGKRFAVTCDLVLRRKSQKWRAKEATPSKESLKITVLWRVIVVSLYSQLLFFKK